MADHNFMPPFDANKGLEPSLVRAIDHPVRAQFLKLFAEHETISPAEALPLLEFRNVALSNMNYHVWVLNRCELVEATEDPGPTGGSIFRVTSKGEDVLAVLGVPPRE